MSTFQVRPPPRRHAYQDACRLHGVRHDAAHAEDRAGRDGDVVADDAAGAGLDPVAENRAAA